MKLVICDGREMSVRDVGPVIYTLRAGRVPLKYNGTHLLEDDAARELLQALRSTGLYERVA